MAPLPQSPVPRKAFYSHLNGASGILAQVDDDILFMAYETGASTPVTSYAGLTVLGEVGSADAQKLLDVLHGGYAAIATSRAN